MTDGLARVTSISNDDGVVPSLMLDASEGEVSKPPLPKSDCPNPPPLASVPVPVPAAEEMPSTTIVKLGFKIPLATSSLSALMMLSVEVRRRRRGD